MLSVWRSWRVFSQGAKELREVSQLGDPAPLIALLDRAQADGAPSDLKLMIMSELRHHPTEAVAQRLAEVLDQETAPKLRRMVASVLGWVGTSTGRQTLRALADDPDPHVREHVGMSLERLRRTARSGSWR